MTRHIWLCVLAVGLLAFAPHGLTSSATNVELVRVPNGGIQPQVAIDAQGRAHVLYFQGEPAHGDLFYVHLDRQGRFSQPIKVNLQAGSALATGTVRGGHIAIGRNGRVHVAWHGSDLAKPKVGESAPVLYTRMNDAGTAFEPERNVVHEAIGLDADAVAADASGHVYVTWHAMAPGAKGEAERRLWVARSSDDGRTFAAERAASDATTGACGCCGVAAFADPRAGLLLLYRSAIESVHRDTYLLSSRDHGETYVSTKLQDWNIAACPMSTYAFAAGPTAILGAWETDGQIYWTRIDPATGKPSAVSSAPGASKTRKHPSVAANARGETLLAWAEGTGWNKGGSLAWQLFDKNGAPIGEMGRTPGVPVWSLGAAIARPDGGFSILY